MKNMKISAKLIVSFLIVAIIAAIVGGVGITGMTLISNADTELYQSNLLAVDAIGRISNDISLIRMHIRNLVIYDSSNATFQSSVQTLNDLQTEIKKYIPIYQATIVDESDTEAFNQILDIYNNTLVAQTIPAVVKAGTANDSDGAQAALDATYTQMGQLNTLLQGRMDYNSQFAQTVADSNKSLATTMTVVSIIVLVLAVVVAMVLGMYISGIIGKPTRLVSGLMTGLVKTGNFHVGKNDMDLLVKYAAAKDEIGETAQAFDNLLEMLLRKCKTMEDVASGDLTTEVVHRSSDDTMGAALQKMTDSLNEMFSEINNATDQVSSGSKQIADGAQALAQGSTEQAASVEELSASISEVSVKTKQNADMATRAAGLSKDIRNNAQKGSSQMDQMMQAVREINSASQNISKVIKAIDDIAFQTNILALNAAVEAARAGQHGKGFAVVAEEVRNLAAKSADAATETGGLIANSIEKAELGARIAEETSASLDEIVSGINESTEIITRIASSSEEQATSINEINTGIDQVAQVIQQNSATSEESAAASEEMSSQATLLSELVSRFKLKGGNDRNAASGRGQIGGMSLGR